jgi:hypothetical protein
MAVIGASSDQVFSSGPIDAVNASHVVVLLLHHNVDFLELVLILHSSARVDAILVLLVLVVLVSRLVYFRQATNLKRLRVSSEDEVLS